MAKKSFANPVVNELKGSAWFKHPDDAPSETTPPAQTPAVVPKATDASSFESSVPVTVPINRANRSTVPTGQVYEAVNRTDRTTVQHPKNKQTVRLAYQLNESQVTSLRRLRATREVLLNRAVSYSEVVREALDLLFEKEGLK
jgi:hypothetical protein